MLPSRMLPDSLHFLWEIFHFLKKYSPLRCAYAVAAPMIAHDTLPGISAGRTGIHLSPELPGKSILSNCSLSALNQCSSPG